MVEAKIEEAVSRTQRETRRKYRARVSEVEAAFAQLAADNRRLKARVGQLSATRRGVDDGGDIDRDDDNAMMSTHRGGGSNIHSYSGEDGGFGRRYSERDEDGRFAEQRVKASPGWTSPRREGIDVRLGGTVADDFTDFGFGHEAVRERGGERGDLGRREGRGRYGHPGGDGEEGVGAHPTERGMLSGNTANATRGGDGGGGGGHGEEGEKIFLTSSRLKTHHAAVAGKRGRNRPPPEEEQGWSTPSFRRVEVYVYVCV